MYPIVLTLHNIARWLVVIFAALALARMYAGMLGRKTWTSADDRAGMLFMIMLDTQILLGILLYFVSPTALSFLSGQAGMGNTLVRFFAVEHVLTMTVAAVMAHVGRSLSKKAVTDVARFRRAATYFTIAVLLILFAIPWPFAAAGRPWLRFGNFTF